MNLLPWLLDWPPKGRTVVLFLVVTAASVGTLLLFAPVTEQATDGNVTVETADLTVRLNDERSLPESDGGGVQTCIASGTPGDSISVIGDVDVDVPAGHDAARADELTVVVSMAHTDETTSGTVESTGGQYDVFWLFADDETLSAGDTAELRIRVRADGETVTTATRSVVVEADSRTYDC